MPQPVKYVNFRATLPGEHKPNSIRKCGAYKFVGGVFEVRVPEKTAFRISRVLEVYYGCETEEVTDEALSKKGRGTKSASTKVAKTSGKDSKRTGTGSKKAADDGGKPDPAEAGKAGPKTDGEDGQGGSDNSDKSNPTDLV